MDFDKFIEIIDKYNKLYPISNYQAECSSNENLSTNNYVKLEDMLVFLVWKALNYNEATFELEEVKESDTEFERNYKIFVKEMSEDISLLKRFKDEAMERKWHTPNFHFQAISLNRCRELVDYAKVNQPVKLNLSDNNIGVFELFCFITNNKYNNSYKAINYGKSMFSYFFKDEFLNISVNNFSEEEYPNITKMFGLLPFPVNETSKNLDYLRNSFITNIGTIYQDSLKPFYEHLFLTGILKRITKYTIVNACSMGNLLSPKLLSLLFQSLYKTFYPIIYGIILEIILEFTDEEINKYYETIKTIMLFDFISSLTGQMEATIISYIIVNILYIKTKKDYFNVKDKIDIITYNVSNVTLKINELLCESFDILMNPYHKTQKALGLDNFTTDNYYAVYNENYMKDLIKDININKDKYLLTEENLTMINNCYEV